MKTLIIIFLAVALACPSVSAQATKSQLNVPVANVVDTNAKKAVVPDSAVLDTVAAKDAVSDDDLEDGALAEAEETPGLHKLLKTKFIEGNAGFMSLVALALVLGLAFCIERIIYLTLSEINAKKFMADVDKLI